MGVDRHWQGARHAAGLASGCWPIRRAERRDPLEFFLRAGTVLARPDAPFA